MRKNPSRRDARLMKFFKMDQMMGIIMEAAAAAYAETGDFAAAIHWQEQALALQQVANRQDARRRLELYKLKQAYHQD